MDRRCRRVCGRIVSSAEVGDRLLVVWRKTLLLWHWSQHRAQVRASFRMDGHTNLSVSRLVVDRIDGWERLWMVSKTWRRKDFGTKGRGRPILVSQRTLVSLNGMSCSFRLADL